MHKRATSAFPEATFVGATVYTIAIQSIATVVIEKPASNRVRLPNFRARGRANKDTQRLTHCKITVFMKGRPDLAIWKKNVASTDRLIRWQNIRGEGLTSDQEIYT